MVRLWMRRLMIGLFLVCLLGSNIKAGAQASQVLGSNSSNSISGQMNGNQPTLPPGFQLVRSTPTSLVVDIQGTPYNFKTALSEGQTCQILKADGYFQTSLPGEPGLLSAGTLLGVPIGSDSSFTILSIDTVDIPGQIDLCPVATPLIKSDRIELDVDQGEVLTKNTLAYSQDVFLPTQPISLVISGMIRSQRVARLNFTPFLYNPAKSELRFIRHITVELQLGKDGLINPDPNPVDEGPFETLLQKILVNYDQARPWRSPRLPQLPKSGRSTAAVPMDQPQYKIQVTQDGLYQVSYAALQSAGVPVDALDPRSFRLLNQGIEIPIFVFGEQDGDFNPDDYLLFYGQKINTKFSNSNFYWLSWGGENGLRMSSQDGTVHGTTLQNHSGPPYTSKTISCISKIRHRDNKKITGIGLY